MATHEHNETENIDDEDDFYFETEEKSEDIGIENVQSLEKLKRKMMQQHLSGCVSGSVQATDRLMKELLNIYKSDLYKNKSYTVTLLGDSIYDWSVSLKNIDVDSELFGDLMKLKEKEGVDCITLSILFGNNYPFEPPLVKVLSPPLYGGYVGKAGALCMELLRKNGWSSAYSVEAVIVQVAAMLTTGGTRVKFLEKKSNGCYWRSLNFEKDEATAIKLNPTF